PAGVDPVVWQAMIPKDNQPTAARIELGRKLYFDARLSADGTVACATCHDVTRGFADRRPVSEGIGDKLGRRSAPTTLNAALLTSQFWDGRAATLEAQAILPIVNPIEMGHKTGREATAAIASDPAYTAMFKAAYGRAPNYDDIGRSIAAFERTLMFLDAPLDRYLRGDTNAISESARRGWVLFNGKGRCVTCHPMNRANPIGSDGRFHNVGVSARHQKFGELARQAVSALAKSDTAEAIDRLALETDASELGRFLVTRNRADLGGFRTPTLRNTGITAPYMHDGTMPTLWDVMDHYNKGGEANLFLDGGIESLALTEPEISDLVALMFTLTDDRFATENTAELARQRAAAAVRRPFRDDALSTRKKLQFE
ncbi:MAG: uncharacterized protein H6Q90_530, partial [Deltaproteobacteria bacterium]|nr:uncharacterized protein [Deltaproteobacteria bacterium]